jgi:hypothetical protein
MECVEALKGRFRDADTEAREQLEEMWFRTEEVQ